MIMAIRGKLYRARNGEIFGVCKGLAKWAELPVGPIRLAAILLAVFSGFVPVLIVYVLAAVFLPVEPLYKSGFGKKSSSKDESNYDDFREDFRKEYRENRKRTVHDLKDEFDKLKRKVAGMEDEVLHEQDKEQDWDKRFNKDTE